MRHGDNLAQPFDERGKPLGRFRMTAWCLPPGSPARRAREVFREQLSKPSLDLDVLDELEIVVSELVTNAARYAPGPYELRFLYDHGLPVRTEVVDAGAGTTLIEHLLNRPPDIPERVDDLELGGRGLRIVAELTHGHCGTQWTRLCGTGQLGTGVWFDLPAGQDFPTSGQPGSSPDPR
ncbi:ATP-binding protein [Streptosporangium sp. NPDC002721]|uniref:ATP-binding protein n=1 Tax=Streptosporangium sp. NPDC002721 TaxID=3366188 RepID=UPI00368C932D